LYKSNQVLKHDLHQHKTSNIQRQTDIIWDINKQCQQKILNQRITDTLEHVMINSDILFTDGVMGTGTSGVTAGKKMKIKALWSWDGHEYELGKRIIDIIYYHG